MPLERRAIEQLRGAEPANADDGGSSLVVADLSGFMLAELPPPKFVVEKLIPSSTATLLGAHGGSGKSVCALTISAHVAASRPWAGFQVDGGRVVFVSLEDPAPLVLYRLRRIVTAYSLPDDLIEANLVVLDGTDGDASLGVERAPYGDRVFIPTGRFEYLRTMASGSRLVVIDNASDAFDGNENERRMVRAFVRMLAGLARDHGTAVLLLAHIDKNAARNGAQGNSYSGSTAWHNSARSRLALMANGQTVQLVQEKSNLGRLAEPLTLSWSQHGVLVPSTWAIADAADTTDDADSEGLLSALVEAATHGVTVPASRTGPSTAQKALETLDVLPVALRGLAGRGRFWRAMNRLQRDGCASSEEYKTPDRKIRSRIVAVASAPIVCARQSPIPPAHGRAQSAAPAPICANAGLAHIGADRRTCDRCDGEGCMFCGGERSAA